LDADPFWELKFTAAQKLRFMGWFAIQNAQCHPRELVRLPLSPLGLSTGLGVPFVALFLFDRSSSIIRIFPGDMRAKSRYCLNDIRRSQDKDGHAHETNIKIHSLRRGENDHFQPTGLHHCGMPHKQQCQ
jgi:hypothetical protein